MSQFYFHKILVPLDGSQNSFRALSYACSLAESCKGSLELLYVVHLTKEISAYTQINSIAIPDSVIADAQENGKNILSQCLRQIPADISASSSIEIGLPPDKIVEISRKNKADLIIIGSRGLGVLQGILMGSVSNYVVHHARCPVMVVK